MEEIWLPIPEWEGLYEVSNFGQVRSLHFGKIKIRVLGSDSFGYKFVKLKSADKKAKLKIGRLVAEVFIPNPDNLPTVDHIDRNPSNNHVENLRWVTQGDNNRNRDMGDKVRGIKNPRAVLTEQKVIRIRQLYKTGLGTRKIAKLFGITKNQAESALKNWQHLKSS